MTVETYTTVVHFNGSKFAGEAPDDLGLIAYRLLH
jgi:hypothetical protein